MVLYITMTDVAMLFSIDLDDPRPLYVQIADEARRLIALGTLKPGEPMPSVRALSSALRINHLTVVQAYGTLEADGLLDARRGRGTFVSARARASDQRGLMIDLVAERALQAAARHGVTEAELLEALRVRIRERAAKHQRTSA